MKKTTILKTMMALAAAFIVAFCSICLAETVSDIDLSVMSTDDLISLRKQINEEIQIRLGEGGMIYAGDYQAGKDIIAGTYTITCTKEDEKGSDGMIIAVFDDDENYQTYKDASVYYDFRDNATIFIGIDQDETAMVTIEDGQHLIIRWGEGDCKPHVASWAP